MAKNKFPPADKIKVISALIGMKDDEDPAAYYKRITAELHDASDHKFESGEIPGVCKHCGWIHPDLACDDCGEPMREHVEAFAALLSGDVQGTVEIEVVIVSTPRRRGLFDWLN